MKINISKVENSRANQIDFDNLPFGKILTDHMFMVDYQDGQWQEPNILPVQNLSVHPANLAWHYGQSIFEGMKASVNEDGTPLLFRVEEHAKRMNASARRMCMPEIPEELFVGAITELVRLEHQWIPPKEGSALYIRPLMFATEEFIGVRPSSKYTFLIFTCPVGPYYDKPVSLRVEDTYVRATPGGVGEAKTAGNYAASLYPAELAIKAGFDQVMWMDPYKFKYVQEVGTMNIFFVIDGKVCTPALNGAILKGITRSSVIEILQADGVEVVEKPLSIKKIFKAFKKGLLQEVFGSGTAAVISVVNQIAYKDHLMNLDPESFKIAPYLKETIEGIRMGRQDDKFGWIQPVPVRVPEAAH